MRSASLLCSGARRRASTSGRSLITGLPVCPASQRGGEVPLHAQDETAKLAQFTDYRMVSVVGGQSIEEQGFKLRKVRPPSCAAVVLTAAWLARHTLPARTGATLQFLWPALTVQRRDKTVVRAAAVGRVPLLLHRAMRCALKGPPFPSPRHWIIVLQNGDAGRA